MIPRYTREEMGALWAPESRFDYLLTVEKAVALAQGELGIIPLEAAKEIESKGSFDLERISEIEAETRHDVIAFVSATAEKVGPSGKYIHFGMTSSDVLDTALSLQIREAGQLLMKTFEFCQSELLKLAKNNKDTLCSGRTHGIHAEPTTFGLKMLGHACEFERQKKRLHQALEQMAICKLSGAVGTSSTQDPRVEAAVAKTLDLQTEWVATQVVPRDRHAELLCALGQLGASIERIATELRHLQRTEVSEVVEGFKKGQKGSSAMPHKKNPISAENLTGQARMLRSYAGLGLENVALWHERDISHSSVERVVLPDAFILADYSLARLAGLLEGLVVQKERMIQNMDLSSGGMFSSHLLLVMVEAGLSREEAYKKVQSLAHSLKPGEQLKNLVKKDCPELPVERVDQIFSGELHRRSAVEAFETAWERIFS